MKTKYLVIPVNIYSGQVEIKGKEELHPLHKLILKLAVSVNDLDKLVNSFNLHQQIVFGAIIDLLYRQLVHLDLENSKIYTVSKVKTAIDRDRLDDFLGETFPQTAEIEWVQDNVTGQIFMLEEASYFF